MKITATGITTSRSQSQTWGISITESNTGYLPTKSFVAEAAEISRTTGTIAFALGSLS